MSTLSALKRTCFTVIELLLNVILSTLTVFRSVQCLHNWKKTEIYIIYVRSDANHRTNNLKIETSCGREVQRKIYVVYYLKNSTYIPTVCMIKLEPVFRSRISLYIWLTFAFCFTRLYGILF